MQQSVDEEGLCVSVKLTRESTNNSRIRRFNQSSKCAPCKHIRNLCSEVGSSQANIPSFIIRLTWPVARCRLMLQKKKNWAKTTSLSFWLSVACITWHVYIVAGCKYTDVLLLYVSQYREFNFFIFKCENCVKFYYIRFLSWFVNVSFDYYEHIGFHIRSLFFHIREIMTF